MSSSSSTYTMPSSVRALLSAAGMPYPTDDSSSTSSLLPSTLLTTTAIIHTTTNQAASTDVPQRDHHSLGTGAAAGIGVGAGLGIVLVILSVFAVLWRRGIYSGKADAKLDAQQRSSSDSEVEVQEVHFKSEQQASDSSSDAPDTPWSEAPDTSPGAGVREADDTQRLELAGPWYAAELDGGHTPPELSAGHPELEARHSEKVEQDTKRATSR